MFFLASANDLSSSLSATSTFNGPRLRDQNVLKNEIVEQAQLGGEDFFLRQRLRRVARPLIGLFDICAFDLPAIDTAHVSADTCGVPEARMSIGTPRRR